MWLWTWRGFESEICYSLPVGWRRWWFPIFSLSQLQLKHAGSVHCDRPYSVYAVPQSYPTDPYLALPYLWGYITWHEDCPARLNLCIGDFFKMVISHALKYLVLDKCYLAFFLDGECQSLNLRVPYKLGKCSATELCPQLGKWHFSIHWWLHEADAVGNFIVPLMGCDPFRVFTLDQLLTGGNKFLTQVICLESML